MQPVSWQQINAHVLRKQHLTDASQSDDVAVVAADVCGLHATEARSPYLSSLSRTVSFSRDALDSALYRTKSLARIRCVRRTIYIHPKERVATIHAATRVLNEATVGQRLRYYGLSQTDYDACTRDILRLLEGQAMTSREINAALDSSLPVSAVVGNLCDTMRLVRVGAPSGWTDRSQCYARLADWMPDVDLGSVDVEVSRAAVARWYLTAFGPATVTDMGWWTGLGKTRVRRALESLDDEVVEMSLPGISETGYLMRAEEQDLVASDPLVGEARLLPVLDAYTMGYRLRQRFLDDAHVPYLYDRAGNGTSIILVNGRAAGVWDLEGGDPPTVLLHALVPLNDVVRASIQAQAVRAGQMTFDQPAEIEWVERMPPLHGRKLAAFQYPLKESMTGTRWR